MRSRLALALVALVATPLWAQSVRVRSVTTTRYAQLRPIRYDTASGTYRAESVAHAAPLTQEVELSAWGLGVPGLRGYALLRGRAALGSELVWPRSDDHFDALYAFVELERPRYRLRGGRQQRASGLGFYAFDGLTATWRPWPTVRLEGFGGRGLARGFLEPVGSPAIRSLDPLRPDRGTVLFGASLWTAPSDVSSISAIYQRELLSNRSGLVSERAAVDARMGVGERVVLSTSADADLAAGEWGKAKLGALLRFGQRSYVEVEAFRYRPLLDLTTIWGAFTPEAHRGLTASLRVSTGPGLALASTYTYRRYQPIGGQTPFLVEVKDEAHLLSASLRWLRGDFVLDGTYRLLLGFGGAQSGGETGLGYARPDAWYLGARGAAFQQEGAFRVSDGTVYGAGVEARGPIGTRAFLRGELMRYLHRRLQGQAGVDWSQTRALLALEVVFGANPDRLGAPR
ncbi:MAG: hypothetical protein HYR48_03405 [Gemmatimonadetes bacterium]|nr:hypothetical protein [Gemmatimonadota bacterium]